MANNRTNPELYALGKMLDMYLMQPQMYQPVTGIGNGRGDILDGIQAGMNLKRNWLNRGIQKNINNDILQEREKIRALNPFGGNNNKGTQQQVVQQQAVPQQQYLITQQPPQRDVYSVGSPVISVGEVPQQPGFGSVLKTDNPYPFGVSVNSETPSSTENNVSGVEQRLQPQVQVGTPQQISSFQQALQSLPSAKYLGDEYRTDNYIRNLQGQGYGAVIGRLADLAFMNPLRESAKADRTQEALRQYLTSPDPQVKRDAMTQLSIDYNNPTLADDIQHKKDAAQLARDRLLIEAGFMPEWMEPYAGGAEGGGNTTGNSLIDSVYKMKEQGYSFDRYDENGNKIGTNCLATFTEGEGLADTPYKGITWIPTAIDVAKKNGDWHPAGDGYAPKPGDIAIVPGGKTGNEPDGHAVMVNYDGGTIQNSRSGNGGKGGIWEDKQSPEEMYKGKGGVTGYISTSRYGKSTGTKQSAWGALRLTPKELARRAKNQAEMDYKRALLGLRAEDNAIKRERIAARYGVNSTGNRQLSQKELEKLNKAKETMADAGYSLSQTEGKFDEDADGKKVPTKEYNASMDKFVNSLGTIYDSEYSDKDLSKLSTLGIAVDFYKRVNENNLGVTPETLSMGIAKIVSRKRRDIYPDKLQEQLLDYIYNEDKENEDGGNQENNTKQNTQKKGNPINDLTFQEQNFVDLDEVNRPSGYNKEYEAEQIARRIGERKREDEKARERQKRENINAELRRRRDEETATSLNDEFEKYFGI